MTRTSLEKSLLTCALVLSIAGAFFFVLWFVAIPCFLAAIVLVLTGSKSPTALAFSSAVSLAISLAGFWWLFATWGTYEYSLKGYVVLFGPVIAGISAVLFFVAFVLSKKAHQR